MRFVYAGVLLFGALLWIGMVAAAVLIPTYAPDISGDAYFGSFGIAIVAWNGLQVVMAIGAIVDTVRLYRRDRLATLGSSTLLAKLAGIPFFAVNFFFLAWIAFFASFAHGASVIITPVAAVLTYLVMLGTSVYGWGTIAALRRRGQLSRNLAILYSVLLLVFVADVVAGVILFVQARRSTRAGSVASQPG